MGVINVKTYEKRMEVLAHLEQNEYRFVESIGDGAFGSVIKVKHLKTEEELAVKIVEKKFASDAELTLWKSLQHENIVPLNKIQFAYYADSYLFFYSSLSHHIRTKSYGFFFCTQKECRITRCNLVKTNLGCS